MSSVNKSSAPSIGPFWFHKQSVLAAMVEAKAVAPVDGLADYNVDHVDLWPKFQGEHPELRQMEYFEIPRGRVIYKMRTKTFTIYLDKVLMKPKIKAALVKAFDLPPSKTKFASDPHYTTDAEGIARLFMD